MRPDNILKLLGDRYIIASEDSLIQAKSLEFLFKKNGIKSKIFSNADDAYEYVLEAPPALIISDIIMPGTDGFEYCNKIKLNPVLSHIPVILLSALQDSDDIIKGLQAGADNFITKPFDENDLMLSIEHLLSNPRVPGEEPCGNTLNVVFRGKEYEIKSGKRQIVDLMLSLYETASKKNSELQKTKSKLERANEEMHQANNDLESFARTVSHDLKSPISVILGFASILMEKSEHCNAEEKEYLKYIIESSEHMVQLINDLLAFAQSGKAELEKEDFDISALASEICEALSYRFPDFKPELLIEPEIIVHADKRLMKVALDNLFNNAFKYSAKSENPKISFGLRSKLGNQILYIQDTGVGFDPAKSDKLFQPFVRLHGNEYSGTGVGLSTVKRIINKHGGEIWVESEPGKGSVFYFTLV
jgi:signal transduction histidine kinase